MCETRDLRATRACDALDTETGVLETIEDAMIKDDMKIIPRKTTIGSRKSPKETGVYYLRASAQKARKFFRSSLRE
jgi:hypothetical protein